MKTSYRKTSHTPRALLSAIPGRFRTRLVKVSRRQALALLIGILLLNSNLLVRVSAADGDLDLSFDGDGKVVTGFVDSFFDGACAVAVQADSKIVAAGIAMDPNFSGTAVVGLVRYNVDGSLDQNFGTGGLVLTDFHNHSLFDGDLAIQNDGKILFAGTVGDVPDPSDFGVARFDTNGNPDSTFGIGGKVITDFFGGNDAATSMGIQGDGKIVLAGFVSDTNSFSDFALARYDTSGNLDQTFGVGGKIVTDFFGLEDEANGIAIQSDGKIVVGGTVTITSFITDFGLARYDTNGNLDQTFGNGGKVTTDVGGTFDQGNALAIQSDGKIVIAGIAANGPSYDFTLIRYDGSGGVDATFGVGGIAFTDFFGGPDRVLDLAIQGDGKIVAVGSVNNDPSDVETFSNFGIARYQTNGSPDSTFGIGGKVDTDFFATDFAEGVAIQPDCKIVVAGFSWDFNLGSDFALARYDSGGCLVEEPHKCPLSQGYWKNHASGWPVNTLTLGSQSYTKAELLAILNNSTQTDSSVILARQLIAAKINLANGSDPAPVSTTITHADALLSGFAGKLPYKVKSSSTVGQGMTVDGAVLNNYNLGLLTPGCTP